MTQRNLFNRQDIWLFAGLILLALLAYAWRSSPAPDGERFAQVTIGRQIVWTASFIGDHATFESDSVQVTFSPNAGAARFISSDCPDQICVHAGWLYLPGQIAVCVPNRTSLLIVGERRPQNDIPDTFAY